MSFSLTDLRTKMCQMNSSLRNLSSRSDVTTVWGKRVLLELDNAGRRANEKNELNVFTCTVWASGGGLY
ncbi:hypothetical protein LSTR_LSTR009181 [Laodelphax striatellus]|uniref:Uncharacterized protein n=1 Tax=Laodelphax striatellus TaxID=195883 RepID=A0A482XE54_LAOST|nr:hypothetical protein LSTR_LSTR009181 [Laodelphax striatellus]